MEHSRRKNSLLVTTMSYSEYSYLKAQKIHKIQWNKKADLLARFFNEFDLTLKLRLLQLYERFLLYLQVELHDQIRCLALAPLRSKLRLRHRRYLRSQR